MIATLVPVNKTQAAVITQGLLDWLYDFSNKRINYRLMDERRTLPPHVVLELFYHQLSLLTDKLISFDASQKTNFNCSRLGEVMAYILLLAALNKKGGTKERLQHIMTVQWLRQKIDNLKTQFTKMEFAETVLDKCQVASVLQGFPKLDLEQLLPDEIKSIDNYILNGKASKAGA